MSVVLMYHALYRDDDVSLIAAEDRPYAVSEAMFVQQLDGLLDRHVGLLSPATESQPDVVITFDDGHLSNHSIALPLLLERGLSAYFFITSDFIDERPEFCNPRQLAELAEAGMAIGGHGVSHRFFDDLSTAQAKCELGQCRDVLAGHSGEHITSMSFPGGRYTDTTVLLAHSAGYRTLFGSRFGTINGQDPNARQVLNRVAIRHNTGISEFERIINEESSYYTIQQCKQQLKWLVKRALGNRLYHGLYKSISTR